MAKAPGITAQRIHGYNPRGLGPALERGLLAASEFNQGIAELLGTAAGVFCYAVANGTACCCAWLLADRVLRAIEFLVRFNGDDVLEDIVFEGGLLLRHGFPVG